MPLVDLILSFTKKHSAVYNSFIEAWLELREARDIGNSLSRMYECLEYEQMKHTHHRCLECFIDGEMVHFIYGLQDLVPKQIITDFLVRLVSILPSECFARFDDFFDMVFTSKQDGELAVALAYSERIVVFGCRARSSLTGYVLRFFFSEGPCGEYARACVVYLLCSEETFEYFRRVRFIETVAQQVNRIYLELREDTTLYLSLLQFVSYYAKKEADLYRKSQRGKGCENTDMVLVGHKGSGGSLHNSMGPGMHTCRSPLLQRKEAVDSKCPSGYVIFDLIEFPYRHTIRMYKEILENVSSSDLRTRIIDSVVENMKNDKEHIGLIRECIEKHPYSVAPYFIKKKRRDWSPVDILQRINGMRGEETGIEVPRVCHVGRCRASLVDFLLENKVRDDLVFLFIWVVSRETFYGHFDEISEIFRGHRSFWGDLWRLILEHDR